MTTKLTLSLNKKVISDAKRYAQSQGRSLSEMVETYFKIVTIGQPKAHEIKPSAKLSKLRGILPVEAADNYKQMLEDAISKKHAG